MPTQKRQSTLQLHARQMRSWLTPSEARLFAAIRAGQLGVAFRRQVVLGRFVVDFLAPQARLVVEVDGECHQRRRSADARRDAKLKRLGYRVLRLDAELVMKQLPVALERIRQALSA